MKDTKFTELLNLYLDHQISPEETALLEAEIRRDPARRRLYRQYCQMQKACAELAADFHSEVPTRDKVVNFPVPRRSVRGLYAAGLEAAAACIALVVVNRRGTESIDHSRVALAPAAVELAQTAAPALPVMSLTERPRPELHTAFTTQALAQLNAMTPGEMLAAEASNRARYEWMNQVRVNPLQLESVMFETEPVNGQENRTFRSRRPFEANVQMSAFQFQR